MPSLLRRAPRLATVAAAAVHRSSGGHRAKIDCMHLPCEGLRVQAQLAVGGDDVDVAEACNDLCCYICCCFAAEGALDRECEE
jgi:hypothetical protein